VDSAAVDWHAEGGGARGQKKLD